MSEMRGIEHPLGFHDCLPSSDKLHLAKERVHQYPRKWDTLPQRRAHICEDIQ